MRIRRYYVLDGHDPIPTDDENQWARMFIDAKARTVAVTNIGPVRISTVFLGMDHNWGEGPPMLFETMIFDGEHDGYQERCSTWDEAEKQHEEAVRLVNQDESASDEK